jgi:hypothetical protein
MRRWTVELAIEGLCADSPEEAAKMFAAVLADGFTPLEVSVEDTDDEFNDAVFVSFPRTAGEA